jgi:hypothetical protein
MAEHPIQLHSDGSVAAVAGVCGITHSNSSIVMPSLASFPNDLPSHGTPGLGQGAAQPGAV